MKLTPHAEKKLLQVIIIIACLVPLSAGLFGMVSGVDNDINLDSHFRYLSGLLFAIGLGFLSAVPNIEKQMERVRLLTIIVIIGGIGRVIAVIANGAPDMIMTAALVMELVITPLICAWQARVSKILYA